jgi:glycosyltransferase involved in cell wall biosynthesis
VIAVVHVAKYYPPVPGGMERVVESLCASTRGRVASSVIAFNAGGGTVREVVDGVPVTRVGVPLVGGSVPVAPALVGELRRARADVMVLHEPNPWALLSAALARPTMPLAIWFHSEVIRPRLQYALFYHPMVRAVYGRARRIIVSSPALGESARALAPYRDRVRVIPFGIDADRWRPAADVLARARDIRAASNGRPIVLFAGRMVPYKGLDVLLRAIAPLDVDAVLAGDGPSRQALTQQARGPMQARVRFPGEVADDELRALYHACDVFVLPSVTPAEAFGYVQLEAMACGKPVISTRVASGVPWVNRDGETGLTVPPGDADALRHAIARLCADADLRARMGEAGRARVGAEFTLSMMAERTIACYEEIARS